MYCFRRKSVITTVLTCEGYGCAWWKHVMTLAYCKHCMYAKKELDHNYLRVLFQKVSIV